jgi:hypothetical protein
MTEKPQRLNAVQVAQRLGVRYLKARDLMLSKQFGECTLTGRTLTVSEEGVRLFEESKGARRVDVKRVKV